MNRMEITQDGKEFFLDRLTEEYDEVKRKNVTIRKNIAVCKTYDAALEEKRKFYGGK